jgi:hypothetical protein
VAALDPEDAMLASMQEFITSLIDWLPQALQHVAELAVYFVLLTVLMMIPLFLWLGYAIASTKKRESGTTP